VTLGAWEVAGDTPVHVEAVRKRVPFCAVGVPLPRRERRVRRATITGPKRWWIGHGIKQLSGVLPEGTVN